MFFGPKLGMVGWDKKHFNKLFKGFPEILFYVLSLYFSWNLAVIWSDNHLENKSLPWDYDFRFVIEEINNINDKAQVDQISKYLQNHRILFSFADYLYFNVLRCVLAGASSENQSVCGGMEGSKNRTNRCEWSGDPVITLKCFILLVRRWMSLRRYWSTSGILSSRFTAWTRLVDRECWRRCPECEFTEIEQSHTN